MLHVCGRCNACTCGDIGPWLRSVFRDRAFAGLLGRLMVLQAPPPPHHSWPEWLRCCWRLLGGAFARHRILDCRGRGAAFGSDHLMKAPHTLSRPSPAGDPTMSGRRWSCAAPSVLSSAWGWSIHSGGGQAECVASSRLASESGSVTDKSQISCGVL